MDPNYYLNSHSSPTQHIPSMLAYHTQPVDNAASVWNPSTGCDPFSLPPLFTNYALSYPYSDSSSSSTSSPTNGSRPTSSRQSLSPKVGQDDRYPTHSQGYYSHASTPLSSRASSVGATGPYESIPNLSTYQSNGMYGSYDMRGYPTHNTAQPVYAQPYRTKLDGSEHTLTAGPMASYAPYASHVVTDFPPRSATIHHQYIGSDAFPVASANPSVLSPLRTGGEPCQFAQPPTVYDGASTSPFKRKRSPTPPPPSPKVQAEAFTPVRIHQTNSPSRSITCMSSPLQDDSGDSSLDASGSEYDPDSDSDYSGSGRMSKRQNRRADKSMTQARLALLAYQGESGASRRSPLPMPVPVPHLTKKSRGRKVPVTTKDEGESAVGVLDESVQIIKSPKKGRKGGAASSNSSRAYKCEVEGCGKAFFRGEHLKRHVRSIHTYEKPHICPYAGCGRAFNRMDNLGQHFKVHL